MADILKPAIRMATEGVPTHELCSESVSAATDNIFSGEDIGEDMIINP